MRLNFICNVFILNQNFIAVYSLYKNIKAVVLGVLYFCIPFWLRYQLR